MLKGLRILDLTHRLPGPLAGKILSDLGAEVIKIEDEVHKDPFLSGMFSSFDSSFISWYEELNRQKKILRFDFKNPSARAQIRELLKESHGVLLSLGPKLKTTLGLRDEDLSDLPLSVVELEASSTHPEAMHDLNALALSGLLSLHTDGETDAYLAPPFLPVAGIAFGQQVATQLLASLVANRSKKFHKSVCYLHDSATTLLSPFWPKDQRELKRTQFLHNGAYPCYCLYRTLDGHYVALAAVEEKFWINFQNTFSSNLPLERRFETSEIAFIEVAKTFAQMSADEIEKKSKNIEMCLSIVRNIR